MSRPPSKCEKEDYVRSIFSSIVPRYDLLNAALSLGRHAAWRRFAVSKMGIEAGSRALDVCCGTGDLAFEMADSVGRSGCVVGLDFSEPMIQAARDKSKRNGREWVRFCAATADAMPFLGEVFDCAGIAFGLRNVPDVAESIREISRVVRPGGKVVSLEIVGVKHGVLGLLWKTYFHLVGPRAAKLLGGDSEAYGYLSQSVAEFMSADQIAEKFEECGLRDVKYHTMAMGGVCVHEGVK